MEYNVEINGAVFTLPNYTIKVAEKFDSVQHNNSVTPSMKDRLKNIYDLIVYLIGKNETESAIGKFPEADPNTINIVYLDMIKAYSKPLTDYRAKETEEKLENSRLGDITELLKNMGNLKNISVTANGVPFKAASKL